VLIGATSIGSAAPFDTRVLALSSHNRSAERKAATEHGGMPDDDHYGLPMAKSMSTNLMVVDMVASLVFYSEVVGLDMAFTVDGEQNTDMPGEIRDGVVFASLRAGDTEIMLQERQSLAEDAPQVFDGNDKTGGSFTMYFRVDDVDAVVARLPPEAEIVKPLQQTWYGMNEIWVRDPDGYVVTIGTPESPPAE
jgi:uncharacterized glyoxalase superfamily protein PhnB